MTIKARELKRSLLRSTSIVAPVVALSLSVFIGCSDGKQGRGADAGGEDINCTTKGEYEITDTDQQYSTIVRVSSFQSALRSSFPSLANDIIEKGDWENWGGWSPKNGDKGRLIGTVLHPFKGNTLYILRIDICSRYVYVIMGASGIKGGAAMCKLSCSATGSSLSVGLSCGSGSRTCNYSYDSSQRVTGMSCTYGNGKKFSCSINYNSLGQPHGSCSGEGQTCTF